MRYRVFLICLLSLLVGVASAQTSNQTIIPNPMPILDSEGDNIINVVLLGVATSNDANIGLTDSLHLVTLNTNTRHVAIVSVPRDLYVYVPPVNQMAKLNQTYYLGENAGIADVTGESAIQDTFLYNLGVHVDYYVRINFNGFTRLINRLGGVSISVDCAIQDWRLKSPELDIYDENSWEMFTLENGVHVMDGDLALWYARSRRTTLETDRGRRQQDLLRAIWRKIRERGLLDNLPLLLEDWDDLVQTNLPFSEISRLLPLVATLNTNDLSYFTFILNRDIRNAYTPDADQRFIFIPDRDNVERLMREAIMPSQNSLSQQRPLVGIVNLTGVNFFGQVASDRLELEGFRTIILQEQATPRLWNLIIDYTGADKNNPIERLRRALATTPEGIRAEPDPNRTIDYKVYLGANYPYYACTRPIIPPKPTIEEGESEG